MISGYIGRPGSGKTYTLTELVLRAANSGRDVFTNYPVVHPNVWQFGPRQLLDLPPGLVVIDEAHLWFASRQSLRLPISWLQGMSQTRKKGWDLLWSTQHESRVDRVIRDVTSWMWLCTAWFNWGGHPMIFRAQSWEPEFFRNPDPKRRGLSTTRFFSSRVAAAYNTMGSVEGAEHLRSATDVYAAADQ